MKANELIIGDWVCYNSPNKYYTKVEEIRCKDKAKIYYIRGYRDSKDSSSERLIFGDFSMDNLYPILLTPEILEKNGFIKSTPLPGIHARCYDLDNEEEKYHLTIANYNKYKRLLLDVDSEDSECFNIKCDYVHELQHALRLCGIDKEIVL